KAATEARAEKGAEGVRILREREPDGGSPAVESGARTPAPGLRRQPGHPDVQRLRRSGAGPLRRHGSSQEFLKPLTVAKILVFAAACVPAAALAYKFYRFFNGDFNALTATPGDYITDQTGTWTLAFITISLCVTPLRRLTG